MLILENAINHLYEKHEIHLKSEISTTVKLMSHIVCTQTVHCAGMSDCAPHCTINFRP